MAEWFGKDVFKLGFGLMRLPKLKDGTIDIEQTKDMVDAFLAAGGTYFDTAYVYDNGESEKAAKAALVDRVPRESFTLATKLNVAVAKDEASAKKQFEVSLERTGAGYFDYYLLHAISAENIEKYNEYRIWDYAKELKEKGLVKYWGFSFHDSAEMLDQLLTEHPDVDFIQLQINYADWENPNVQSRACWETARRHGVSVVVMEPVKGGMLANPPESVMSEFTSADPDASAASWAIRFVASLDGIITVLSGMSNQEQMDDNLSYMRDFKPLDEKEQETVRKAQKALAEVPSIACTGCRYCTDGCPMGIPIPEIFSAMNKNLVYHQLEKARRDYGWRTEGKGKARECIRCGQCEAVCPQHLTVIEYLEQCAETLE